MSVRQPAFYLSNYRPSTGYSRARRRRRLMANAMMASAALAFALAYFAWLY